MSRLSKLLLSIPLCVMPVVQADSAQDTLKRFVDGVQTFDARFDQTQTDERGTVTARSSGRFLLSRPAAGAKSDIGRFRWAYEKPYEQLSICDGTKLWAFDPDLNQATVRNAKSALAGTPAALLSQRGGLTDAFVVQDGGSDGDARVVRLLPKAKDSDFKSIELSIDKAGAPLRMRFQDPIGGSSEVKFSTVATNKPIDAAQFQFTPPKGTEIVDGDSAPSAGGAASRP
jgi:outer membrane lipoprotein carrier protein